LEARGIRRLFHSGSSKITAKHQDYLYVPENRENNEQKRWLMTYTVFLGAQNML
jgi:hypothetical protein